MTKPPLVSNTPLPGFERLIGQVFGDVTVIGFDLYAYGAHFYKCQCRCGNVFVENRRVLKSGQRDKCRACKPSRIKLPEEGAMIGRTFGDLTVLRRLSLTNNGFTKYLCFCDCGNLKDIYGSALLSGATESCGCRPKGRKKKQPSA